MVDRNIAKLINKYRIDHNLRFSSKFVSFRAWKQCMGPILIYIFFRQSRKMCHCLVFNQPLNFEHIEFKFQSVRWIDWLKLNSQVPSINHCVSLRICQSPKYFKRGLPSRSPSVRSCILAAGKCWSRQWVPGGLEIDSKLLRSRRGCRCFDF